VITSPPEYTLEKLTVETCRLKNISGPDHTGSDGLSIERRLSSRMGAITDAVKNCGLTCDSYYKRNVLGMNFCLQL
jgi:hypothetical protein